MNKVAYVNITGLRFHEGSKSARIGDKVKLYKEPSNVADSEAIYAVKKGVKIGYVSNSVKTLIRGAHSAGRILDRIEDGHDAEVIMIQDDNIILKTSF